MLREISPVPGIGDTVTVRSANAHLLDLLDEVAAGHVVMVTSDGRPKARIVPFDPLAGRRPFARTRAHLAATPPWRGGPSAEETVRNDRNGRAW